MTLLARRQLDQAFGVDVGGGDRLGFVFDEGMSNLYGGGIDFVTKRLAVPNEDAAEAERLLAEALRDAEGE